jgi:hypothetical protein
MFVFLLVIVLLCPHTHHTPIHPIHSLVVHCSYLSSLSSCHILLLKLPFWILTFDLPFLLIHFKLVLLPPFYLFKFGRRNFNDCFEISKKIKRKGKFVFFSFVYLFVCLCFVSDMKLVFVAYVLNVNHLNTFVVCCVHKIYLNTLFFFSFHVFFGMMNRKKKVNYIAIVNMCKSFDLIFVA